MDNKDFSFIIPALNEEAHIYGVLESIRKNIDGRFLYEVIVMDNGSSDRTVDIALKNGALCFQAPRCTISTLRNLGALKACSDIFVFLDADVYLGKDWGDKIKLVLEKLHDQPHIITGSLYGISDENSWIERIWFAPRTTLKETNYINGGHLIIHGSLFSRVEGFDPGLETGEDYEFCARARRMGARIVNDPELKVVHAGYPKNIKSFFARERWHARGDYKSLKTLASSRPALISLTNLCMVLVLAIGLIFSSRPWSTFPSVYILFISSVSLAASIHRHHGKLKPDFLATVFLYMVYFTARTLSMVDIVSQSITNKRL